MFYRYYNNLLRHYLEIRLHQKGYGKNVYIEKNEKKKEDKKIDR